ncbi:MAG TPA: chloride channel protein, partial [Gemmatimonadaceae bacterium]|nr:chloride channel protein [Gemmatimonadaceae bacterium]
GSVVLSATTSWMVLHLVLGDEPLFHVAAYHLVSPSELGAYAVLGVVGGLGSVAFVKLLLRLRSGFLRLPRGTLWLQPVVGGLTVGLLGYFVPQVLGVGYDQVDRVLSGDAILTLVLTLAVLKIIATAVCYASGNAGGIFGPSMFIGAMLGGAVGQIAHRLLPLSTGGPGAYALVGMGTAFAGIIRTPLTSVIMIFEVTRDYTIIVPLMVSNLIAFYISQRLQHEPIYEALARQDGIHLPRRSIQATHGQPRASSAIREAPEPLPGDLSIQLAYDRVAGSTLDAWPVADGAAFVGMVDTARLDAAVDAGHEDESVMSLLRPANQDGEEGDVVHVHLDQSLSQVLTRMGETHRSVLPVVSRANASVLLGLVTLGDVLKAYGVANGASDPARSADGND